MPKDLTQERLKEIVNYDPDTGIMTWRKMRPGFCVIGRAVGTENSLGYLVCTIDGAQRRVHRLAWLYSYGIWPSKEIDHINNIRNDNRLVNLRDVSRSVNNQNRTQPNKRNKTGILGVSIASATGKFHATIRLGGKTINLGGFDNAESARAAYLDAKQKYHTPRTAYLARSA